MKRVLMLLAVLATLAAGCANDDDQRDLSDNPPATYNEYTTPNEVTVVERTTETTLPSTGGPR